MLVYGLDNETFDSFYFFKNLEIKKEINKLDISCFEIPKEYRNIFKTECKVTENKQNYTIKNIEPFYDGYKIECKQNIDEWLSFFHKSLNFPYKDIETMIKGIIPNGWSYVIIGEIKKYRTITADHKSSWEVLEEIVKKFDVEFRIDNNEKILFISEKIGEDKGVFFSDNFNVVDKDISVESFEFATRIIPEGMNGLKINQINDGKDYLENKSYSGKTINYYWKDERYTNIQSLKDDATKKLEALSIPRITIKLKVKDLSKAIGVYEQEYSVGDYVYLIDKDRKTKERFRILAQATYPNRPFNNEITLANKPLDLASDVDENIELTKEMWEETRGRFEATENLIKGYLENSKKYTDDSFKTYKSEREQTDSKIYETITESTTYVDPNTGQTQPIVDKQLEIIKTVNGIKISVKNNADNLDKKISKEDILEDKEIQEALKGKDGPPGEKGKDGQDGKPGKDGKSGRLGKNLLLDSFREAEGIKDFLIDYDYAEKIEEGEELTLTIKIDKALEESTSLSAYNGKDTLLGELIQSEKDKTKYVLTFNYLDSADDIKKLYIYLTNLTEKSYAIKWAVLARGDIEALDWYGAEEDMQKQIDSKASEESLQDLQVHFAMYPTAEELNQNKVDLIKQQAYLDQLKTAIDSNALSLEERLSVIEANVGAGKLSLEAINTYLHFGEEGVLIGKEGEQVRLRLINNALEITDGTKVVARFANNQTETPNLKVTGAFEFGYHVANKIDLDGNKFTVISSNI